MHNSPHRLELDKTIFDIGEALIHALRSCNYVGKETMHCYFINSIIIFFVLAGGVQSAFQLLKEYEVQLKSIVRKRFDAAVEQKNTEEVIRCSVSLVCLSVIFLKDDHMHNIVYTASIKIMYTVLRIYSCYTLPVNLSSYSV